MGFPADFNFFFKLFTTSIYYKNECIARYISRKTTKKLCKAFIIRSPCGERFIRRDRVHILFRNGFM